MGCLPRELAEDFKTKAYKHDDELSANNVMSLSFCQLTSWYTAVYDSTLSLNIKQTIIRKIGVPNQNKDAIGSFEKCVFPAPTGKNLDENLFIREE